MILVDTSGWIEFYRRGGAEKARELVARAVATDEAATCGLVQVELLAFAQGGAEARLLDQEHSALHWIHLRRQEFDAAVILGRALRGQGIAIPATDLVIASAAIAHGAELYHLDAHFRVIAEHAPLRERHLGESG